MAKTANQKTASLKPRRLKSEPFWEKHLRKIEDNQRDIEALRLEMQMDYAQRIELDALGDRVTHLETQSEMKRSEHSGTFILALIATGSITVIIGCLVSAVFRLDHRMDTQTRKTNWMGDEIIQQRNAYPLPSPVQPSPPAP